MRSFSWHVYAPLLWTLSFIGPSSATAAWPNGPFDTSTRWITDASGNIVQYVGANWAGHPETMVPEGLQYQSIETIVSKLKSGGLNSIRLTYAIQMIDEIVANNGTDVPIRTSFINALGEQNGTTIYNAVVKNNPSFNEQTTRLQVFDAVAAECNKQQVYVHLDNHVSKSQWCCSPFDGNSWWEDTYYNVANWTRGLAYMANHGKNWPNLMSMSLRNELRQPLDNLTLYKNNYNWQDWYTHIQQGVQAIHGANPNLLVFLSGLDSDTTLQPVVEQTALTPGTQIFNRSLVTPYPSKLVLELHNYANILGGPDFTNCTLLQEHLTSDGFSALASNATNPWPIVVSEFGYSINDTTGDDYFVKCLMSYIADSKAGWMQWTLQGSYYIRQGMQDSDETYGLLNHDWSDWRSTEYITGPLATLVNATMSKNGQSANGSTSSGNGTSSGGSSSSGNGTSSGGSSGGGNGTSSGGSSGSGNSTMTGIAAGGKATGALSVVVSLAVMAVMASQLLG